jgi:hypothetical protein
MVTNSLGLDKLKPDRPPGFSDDEMEQVTAALDSGVTYVQIYEHTKPRYASVETLRNSHKYWKRRRDGK